LKKKIKIIIYYIKFYYIEIWGFEFKGNYKFFFNNIILKKIKISWNRIIYVLNYFLFIWFFYRIFILIYRRKLDFVKIFFYALKNYFLVYIWILFIRYKLHIRIILGIWNIIFFNSLKKVEALIDFFLIFEKMFLSRLLGLFTIVWRIVCPIARAPGI
jgi:hypothetical protein